jgi:hypothetical protein
MSTWRIRYAKWTMSVACEPGWEVIQLDFRSVRPISFDKSMIAL